MHQTAILAPLLKSVVDSLPQSCLSVLELAGFVAAWSSMPLAGTLNTCAPSHLRTELEASLSSEHTLLQTHDWPFC